MNTKPPSISINPNMKTWRSGGESSKLAEQRFSSVAISSLQKPKSSLFSPCSVIQTPFFLVKPSVPSTLPLQTYPAFSQIFPFIIKFSPASRISANKPHLSTRPHTHWQTPPPSKYSWIPSASNTSSHSVCKHLSTWTWMSISIAMDGYHLVSYLSSWLPKFCFFKLFLHSRLDIPVWRRKQKPPLLVDIVPYCSFCK